jgi:hypothetical protein
MDYRRWMAWIVVGVVGGACEGGGSQDEGTDSAPASSDADASGDDASSGAGTSTAGAVDSTSGADAATSSADESTSEGGDDPFVPPKVPAACAEPEITVAGTWSASEGERIDGVELAFGGGADAAVLFAESNGDGEWSVLLQRLTLDGDLDGAPLPIGVASGAMPPALSITANAERHVVCHDGDEGGFACSVVVDGVVQPGLAIAGTSPSVAFGPAGLGLVYGSGGQLLAQRLDDDALAVDGPDELASSSVQPDPRLAASSTGYAAIVQSIGGMWRLDGAFAEIEGASLAPWPDLPVDIAGSGATIGAAWGNPDGIVFRAIEDGDEELEEPIIVSPDGSGQVAIARGDASFAIVWSTGNVQVLYAAVSSGGDVVAADVPLVDLGGGDTPVSIGGVPSGFLAAGVTNFVRDGVWVARLACP